MGGIASIHRSREDKALANPAATETPSATNAPAGPSPAEDVKMEEEIADTLVMGSSITEGQLGSLRVKDPEAWRGNASPRPRSALKHGSSSLSCADSEGSAGFLERTPSGRRMPRKVSFQVQGLGSPPELGSGAAAEGVPATKRVRGSEEFSMKFLVEKFYGKVLALKELQPFFDGVDMLKLKNQQEVLMLLLFGGNELLEDELPGLSADLRLIHLHLLFEGLNLTHWQLFANTFSETLDELHQIPEDVKQRAKAYMATTKHHFRPIEPEEWPPKAVYKGWTKRSCPFRTSFKRPADLQVSGRQTADGASAAAAAAATITATAPHGAAGMGSGPSSSTANGEEPTQQQPQQQQQHLDDDDDEFILPGINSPALTTTPPPQPQPPTAL